jgi:hypothetical protein
MTDCTAALARAYSDTLTLERPDTLASADRAADIAAHMRRVWLKGTSERIESYKRPRTLADIVSMAVCDVPGNVLHDAIALIREQANAGNPAALAIVDQLCRNHAAETVELGGEL